MTTHRRAWVGLLCLVGVFWATGIAAHADDASWYTKGATWRDTLVASRAALVAQSQAAATVPGGVSESTWQELGPLFAPQGPNGEKARAFDTVYAVEKETAVNAATRYDNGAGKQAIWRARPDYADGHVIDLAPGDASATFLARTLTSPTAQTLKIYLGSDDSLQVFFNGQNVLDRDVPRGAEPNQDVVDLPLHAGDNFLMLKVINLTGGYAFYYSTSPTPADASALTQLWGLLERDFGADPVAAHEIATERNGAVWPNDISPIVPAQQAQRYVAAIATLAASNPETGAVIAEPLARAQALAGKTTDNASLWLVADQYMIAQRTETARRQLTLVNLDGLRAAIDDLAKTYGAQYKNADEYRARAAKLAETKLDARTATVEQLDAYLADCNALRREALLANPLLDFDKILVVRRAGPDGLPANWQGNSSIGTGGYDNELAVLSLRDGSMTTLYKPEGGRFVGDMDLHWDADRLLFSMPDADMVWQVYEIKTDGTSLRQVTPKRGEVQNFNACYLPDGRILFCSTACYQGVPCVTGSDKVSLLYQLDPKTGAVRQLTFDQDHSWCPTVMESGRVMYTRWEYGDIPHYFSRLLFNMNPDGTDQAEMYGSNSYWPNSIFYAKPVPGQPTKFAAIISGHHGDRREGELIVFDTARGRHEADGAVQRIPGRGKKVEPIITDQLVAGVYPRFLHPWPLSDKYFLVSCQPTANDPWGIYLVDTFDNFTLIKAVPNGRLLEPIPLKARPTPPILPDRVDPKSKTATVYLADVYAGPGLAGTPRGTVKSLRLYSNHFAYPNMGGHIVIGIDGPWDVKRIVGTVPVEKDGSASFSVPASTPIAVEPCDANGKALALMRSWMVAQPGENLSCVGCHEQQNGAPTRKKAIAATIKPHEITPWHGDARGFSFRREVQPTLDKFCVGCHGGAANAAKPDLRDERPANARGFSPSYQALHPFVRRPGPESDYHLQNVGEFYADTSELIQMLSKGHHGVKLDAEAWDRIVTWIDLNVPCLGAWHEERDIPNNGRQKRQEFDLEWAGLTTDYEQLPEIKTTPVKPIIPAAEPPVNGPAPSVEGWPFDETEAQRRQAEVGPTTKTVELPGGGQIELVKVPAGDYVAGVQGGSPDEARRVVRVEKPFWMARCETTNAQYAAFDPQHESRVISETNKDQTRPGMPVDAPEQPVVRVSQDEARGFCAWLTAQTGLKFRLPSEDEWEWAARAGTDTPLYWGALDADFSKFANLADHSLVGLRRGDSPAWMPRIDGVNDNSTVSAPVGVYQPNAWGLRDMLGNVAEWTTSPYRVDPAATAVPMGDGLTRACVRGGSWYSRPQRAQSGSRWGYPAWMRVFDVGFRVVCDA